MPNRSQLKRSIEIAENTNYPITDRFKLALKMLKKINDFNPYKEKCPMCEYEEDKITKYCLFHKPM